MEGSCANYYLSNFEVLGADLKVRLVTKFSFGHDSFAIDLRADGVLNINEVVEFLNWAKSGWDDLYFYSQNGYTYLTSDECDTPGHVKINSVAISYEKTELLASELRDEMNTLRHMFNRERQIINELRDKLQNVQELTLDRLTWLTTSHSKCEVGTELEMAYAKAIKFFLDIKNET